MNYDVAIIGGGVIGCTIARELSRFALSVAVLEQHADVAGESSKANSGIVHAGYDCKPGTLKAKYNILGNPMFDALSQELDFPVKRNGSWVIAFTKADITKLEKLLEQGIKNGVQGMRIIQSEELRRIEPNISPNVAAALDIPTGGIVCPYEMTIAFAENAADNGVEFKLGFKVEHIQKTAGGFHIEGSGEAVDARILINAAGLYADTINQMLSKHTFTITPRRGEYCLLDKTEGALVSHTLFQLPTAMGKGILVTPTVDGNLLLGPTSRNIEDKLGNATTRDGLEEVQKFAALDLQNLPFRQVITSFAGLRAVSDTDDFIIGPSPDVENLINVAGIASPGLSSSPAIAVDVAKWVAEMTDAQPKKDFNPIRRSAPRFRHMTTQEKQKAITSDPNYGHIVCRCEQVTKAEILAAIHNPLGVHSVDAIKRRTRAGMGRCQGGFCLMRLPEIIAAELNEPLTAVTKSENDTYLLSDQNKEALKG